MMLFDEGEYICKAARDDGCHLTTGRKLSAFPHGQSAPPNFNWCIPLKNIVIWKEN